MLSDERGRRKTFASKIDISRDQKSNLSYIAEDVKTALNGEAVAKEYSHPISLAFVCFAVPSASVMSYMSDV